MSAAVAVQEIVVDGTCAGIVIGEQLLLRGGLDLDIAQTAAAMGLLAIEIHAGDRDGPFSVERACALARQAAHQRAQPKDRGE